MMKSKDKTRNDLLIIYSWLGIIGISTTYVLMKFFFHNFVTISSTSFDEVFFVTISSLFS